MVDGVNGLGDGKEWKKIDDTTKNKDYQNTLDKAMNSIMDGKDTISIDKLRKNSLFANLSDKAQEKFNYIAGIDGDNTTINAEELKVLLSLTDAELKDNTFVFDGSFNTNEKSGLEQATDKEIEAVIKNLVTTDTRKKIEELDTSKYNRSKAFADKVISGDVDESMLAIQDKLQTGFVDKRTGKPLSITQLVMLFEDFVNKSYDKGYQNFYYDVTVDFEKETGIPVKDFGRLRCMGDGDSFTIGDWTYEQGKLTNNKTGETVQMKRATWSNTADNTVPAADGYVGLIQEYSDGQGNVVKYNYEDGENIAPTSANILVNGETKNVDYERKESIDQSLYNFIVRY